MELYITMTDDRMLIYKYVTVYILKFYFLILWCFRNVMQCNPIIPFTGN